MTQTVPNFNPRALRGARPFHNSDLQILRIISIHAPLAGRDYQRRGHRNKSRISIHAPLAGRDLPHRLRGPAGPISIHAPLAGRDRADPQAPADFRHFNPRAPCGARLPAPLRPARAAHISIHAPLAGRDRLRPRPEDRGDISIHAPLAGRDSRNTVSAQSIMAFQSTRPLRGATCVMLSVLLSGADFNPRAPCGARRSLPSSVRSMGDFNPRAPCGARQHITAHHMGRFPISIHAPLAGRDYRSSSRCSSSAVFQSTRPLRGATFSMRSRSSRPSNFNPRAPCGARRRLMASISSPVLFQSTRPLRGATGPPGTAPRSPGDFNPRAPCGARQQI